MNKWIWVLAATVCVGLVGCSKESESGEADSVEELIEATEAVSRVEEASKDLGADEAWTPTRVMLESYEDWKPGGMNADLEGILTTSLISRMRRAYPEGIPASEADTDEKRRALLDAALIEALPDLALGLETVVQGDEMIDFMEFVGEKQTAAMEASSP